jgi:hypothetical protein
MLRSLRLITLLAASGSIALVVFVRPTRAETVDAGKVYVIDGDTSLSRESDPSPRESTPPRLVRLAVNASVWPHTGRKLASSTPQSGDIRRQGHDDAIKSKTMVRNLRRNLSAFPIRPALG